MPPRRTFRDEDWGRLRPTIRKLYLEEDRSLKDVLLILGISHGFYPSKAQLEWKLKQWHFTKNMGVMDWKYVGHEIHRRKCRGKETKVYLSGIPLRMKNIERGVSRYCYETAIEKAMRHVLEPPMPEDQPLLVCTPAPQDVDWLCRLDNVPWLISRRLVEGFAVRVKAMNIPYASSNASCEGLVASILFPNWELQSYTGQLRRAYQRLRSIMPEDSERGHAVRAQGLLQTSGSNTINAEFLVCLVFLLSNNLLVNTNPFMPREPINAAMHLLLRLFRESGSDVLAKGQYSRLLPSLQSSLDGLFREAIKTSDLGAVELLLQTGVDVNTSFHGPFRTYDSYSWQEEYGTALQHAAHSNHPELLRILLKHGADTGMIGIHTIRVAWLQRKVSKGSAEETMRILLSIYRFRSEDETQAVDLLFRMSHTVGTPLTETIIEFFVSAFCESSPAAKSQLLITSIRTDSRFIGDLIAGSSSYFNTCGYYPETPATAAVYRGDIQWYKQLLRPGAVFEPRHEAATPLQWAASFSNMSLVQQLLDEGADVNFCHPHPTLLRAGFEDVSSMRFSYEGRWYHEPIGSLGRTALQSALLGGNIPTALCLLAAGAELIGGELVMAIWNRHFQIIGSLLDRGASFQDECTIFGADTILEAAILSENTDLVYQVIKADQRSITGSALCASVFLAKATSDFTTLRHLLTYTSQLLASDETWVGTAMCLAVHLQCMEIPHLILSSGLHPKTSWPIEPYGYKRLRKSLHSASENSIIRSYLSWRRGLRIQSQDQDQDHQQTRRRPMFETAVSLGQLDYLKLLLDHGYIPGPTSSLGLLCASGDLGMVRFLHNLGMKMTERVLGHAILSARSEDTETVRWLLSIGIDLNEKSDHLKPVADIIAASWSPMTPLQEAINKGWFNLMEQLIECGADVNEPASSYRTPLQLAAERGYFGIVQRLLELGADPNAPGAESPYGRTAIEVAAGYGRLDVVQLLLNSGVETSGRGRRQYVRSVAFAEREGHHATAKLLKSHAGWTDADENLLSKNDVSIPEVLRRKNITRYIRGYYSNEPDWGVSAKGEGSKEEESCPEGDSSSNDELKEGEVSEEEDAPEVTLISKDECELTEEKFTEEGIMEPDEPTQEASEASRVSEETHRSTVELVEEFYKPSEAFLLTSVSDNTPSNAYEPLLEVVGLEFLPSSMSYQIREELEGDGCVEESGGDLWAEEYSRFVTELM